MIHKTIKQLLCIVLAVVMLGTNCSAYAYDWLVEDMGASYDQTKIASAFSKELANYYNPDYYRLNSTTYLTSMILSMAMGNIYRLVLDSAYQDIVGTAQNASEAAQSIWQVMVNGYISDPLKFLTTKDSGGASFMSSESVSNVINILRRVLGANDSRLANLEGIRNPDELWDVLTDLSKDGDGNADVYTWEDAAAGNHDVQVGDQVYFKLSAYCGDSNEKQSYVEHKKTYHAHDSTDGNVTEWDTVKDLETGAEKGSEGASAERETVDVTSGYEISFTYVGMVLNSDANGIRCVCGDLDISKIGQPVDGAHAEGMQIQDGSGGGEALDGGAYNDGNGTTMFKLNTMPEWYITVTTKFCHNVIDNDKMMESIYSTYVPPDGPNAGKLITFDINDPKLIEDLMKKTGYPEDEANLLANKLRMLYITESLEAKYGLTVAESIAWQEALLVMTDGDFSGKGIMKGLDDARQKEYKEWLRKNKEGSPTTGNFMEFMQYCIDKDAKLKEEIRKTAMTEKGSIPENIIHDTMRIFDEFFGVPYSESFCRRLFNTELHDRNSLLGQLAKFLNNLADGLVDLGHLVPSAHGNPSLQAWIDPVGDGWYVQTDPVAIIIERLY